MSNSSQPLKKVYEAYKVFRNKSRAARELNMSRSTFCDQLERAIEQFGPVTIADSEVPLADYDGKDKFVQSGDSEAVTIESVSMRVRTVEDAIKKANVDLAVWEVERFTVNSWEVALKLQDDDGWKVKTEPLWQVKVWLRRKVHKAVEYSAEQLIERMRRYAPKYPPITRPKRTGDDHLLEVSLFDAHFGKLAWSPETGSNYDLKIAEKVYLNAVKSLITQASPWSISKILLPIGQDFSISTIETTRHRGVRPRTWTAGTIKYSMLVLKPLFMPLSMLCRLPLSKWFGFPATTIPK